MYAEIKNPYRTLEVSGYQMCGQSNAFKRHTNVNEWFHVYVSHDEKSINIHYDRSGALRVVDLYSKHKTDQSHPSLKLEVKRIRMSEPLSLIEKIVLFYRETRNGMRKKKQTRKHIKYKNGIKLAKTPNA